jgi:hypothetical protein
MPKRYLTYAHVSLKAYACSLVGLYGDIFAHYASVSNAEFPNVRSDIQHPITFPNVNEVTMTVTLYQITQSMLYVEPV